MAKYQPSEADETVTLPLLTSDRHNYDMGVGNLFRLSSTGEWGISGIVFRGNPNIRLVNVGGIDIVLLNEDERSNGPNQIITGNGEAVILSPDDTALLAYDNADLKWRLVS